MSSSERPTTHFSPTEFAPLRCDFVSSQRLAKDARQGGMRSYLSNSNEETAEPIAGSDAGAAPVRGAESLLRRASALTVSQMNPIKIEFPYTETEALRSNRAVTANIGRGLWFTMYVLPPLSLCGFCYGSYLALTGQRTFSEVIFPLVLCVLFASVPLLVKLEIKRNFRKNPNAGKMIRWEFSAERLANSTEGASGNFEWRHLIEVKEVKHGFLLYPQPRLAHWIPKHAFPDGDVLAGFRDMIRQSGVKYNG
jgi:hypothetical protein